MLRWFALAALVAIGCVSAADAQERDFDKDFDLDTTNGNANPSGIWSNGTIMWVADDLTNPKIYAYNMSDKSPVASEDFELINANASPLGIWSNGTIMWVVDFDDEVLYAYNMSNKAMRVQSVEFNTLAGASNTYPAGIWSDGTTMWVADTSDDKIYSYHMSNRTYDGTKDFGTLNGAGNNDPAGIWSDGTTMWVADNADNKIYAYRMSDKERDKSKEFDTLKDAGNTEPYGIRSDGATMWVADSDNDKIYAYKMHPAPAVSSPRVFVYIPPPDTTPPTVKSVERAGNATTTDHTLTWDVRFSESVRVGLKEIHTNHTSVANATIPDLGMVYDTLLAGVPGMVTGGSISVDLKHPITSGLLIELVAPDCTRFTVHNQTTTFPYKLRQPYDLGDLSGVGAAGQWMLHVSDHAKYWNGTLNGWTLYLESRGVVEGGGRTYTITQYVAGPGEYTLSLDGFDIRDRAGNRLVDADPAVNEPYQVVGAARACHTE